MIAAAARLTEPKGPLALTYVTLIGLLYSTVLRPTEAIGLDRADVDLKNGILSIRQRNLENPALYLFLSRPVLSLCGTQQNVMNYGCNRSRSSSSFRHVATDW